MTILEKISNDFKESMKLKDKNRLDALRMIKSEIKNKEIELKSTLDDLHVENLLKRLVAEGKESIEMYKKGGREELAKKWKEYVDIYMKYLKEKE